MPSVVAIFEQIEWNELQQDNVRERLVKKVKKIKLNLIERQIRIVLIFLQNDVMPINGI